MEKKISTPYYIDYIVRKENGTIEAYYQVTRTKDDMILYANPDWHNIVDFLWHAEISPKAITLL